MRAALDSNIMIYAEDMFSDSRHESAINLLEAIAADNIVVPLQALGETLVWLVRKGGVPKPIAAERAEKWTNRFDVQATTQEVFSCAMELVSGHKFQIWDGFIFGAAVHSGADFLFSEDMQHGFTWKGVTVVNPFLEDSQRIIQSMRIQ